MIFCQLHIIPAAHWAYTMRKLWSPQHSCGNVFCMSIRKNLHRVVVCLAFCCRCLCFYCCGIHGCLMNRGSVSDRLQCPCCSAAHPDQGCTWNSPHAVEFCSIEACARLFFIPVHSSTSSVSMVFVCDSTQGGRYWMWGGGLGVLFYSQSYWSLAGWCLTSTSRVIQTSSHLPMKIMSIWYFFLSTVRHTLT